VPGTIKGALDFGRALSFCGAAVVDAASTIVQPNTRRVALRLSTKPQAWKTRQAPAFRWCLFL
jgi:hypothetical protein